jgi:hypothetical protein
VFDITSDIGDEIGNNGDTFSYPHGSNHIFQEPMVIQTQILKPRIHHHTNHFAIRIVYKNKKLLLLYQ